MRNHANTSIIQLVDANFNFLPISSNSLGLTEQNVFLPEGILNNSTFRNPLPTLCYFLKN